MCDLWDQKVFLVISSIRPKVFIDSELVPTVKSGESFKYLGRYFNFEMNNEVHKKETGILSL